ncbi:hypothetical protein [Streptomyces sp. ALB3]|uniref:hypothetical protein n=1 Tax=Streptomyces sp. ALB3 TaxID=3374278 RepID=UPI0037B36B8B
MVIVRAHPWSAAQPRQGTWLPKARISAINYVQHAKGALAVTAATAACHTLMSAGYAWARDRAAATGDTMFSGAFEFLLTTAVSWAVMPLLLWAGMRVMREPDNTVLIVAGGLAWVGLSGYFIDEIDQAGGQIPIQALAAYVLLGTGLAGTGPSHRS